MATIARPAGTKDKKITKSCHAGGKTLRLVADERIGLHYSRVKEEKRGSRVRSRVTLASGGRVKKR